MKRMYAVAIAILVVSLCCTSTLASFDFGVYPGRFYCKGGFTYTVKLELQDNTTNDLTVNLTLEQPPNPDEGYEPLPNLSWVSFEADAIIHEKTVTIKGKPPLQTRYAITQVPVYINIPEEDENKNKQWEVNALTSFPRNDSSGFGITRRTRQRILIETPPLVAETSLLPLGILLFSIVVSIAGYSIYLKKKSSNQHG